MSKYKYEPSGNSYLNRRIPDAFPHLEEEYNRSFFGEPDTMGAHPVYGVVFLPDMERVLKSREKRAAQKYIEFVEEMLTSGDENAINVAIVTIIEGLFYSDLDRDYVGGLWLPESRKIWDEFVFRHNLLSEK